MDDHQIGRAPDYTNAAITMMGINLMWVFFVVWMLWGFVPVILLALMVNHFAERVAERRGITPAFARIRLSRPRGHDV
ncbi:hypothetical protein [Aestuariivita sp.]|jgi:hypothetical protein|uniref:hypothetical protein n=1 Tax=Aestuariivita sp. TaxID=1872407 RepID=UPI0021746A9C|nr:hypothetical protein [Aestuariivita sp.]MCE8007833.1 hypothetical protein [Aestuariivita sp.]